MPWPPLIRGRAHSRPCKTLVRSRSANNNTPNLTPSPACLSTTTVCFLGVCKQRGTEVISFKVKQKSPFLAQPYAHRHTHMQMAGPAYENVSPGVPLTPSARRTHADAQAKGAGTCDGAAARVLRHELPFWQRKPGAARVDGAVPTFILKHVAGNKVLYLRAGQDGERNPTAPQQDEHMHPPTPIQTRNASSIIIHPCSMYNRRVYKSFETHQQKLSLRH